MDINKINSRSLVDFIDSAEKLYAKPIGGFKKKDEVEKYLPLVISKTGFYGYQIEDEIYWAPRSKTEFSSPEDVIIVVEGDVELAKTPTNIGAGDIVYSGKGVLIVDGSIIYGGSSGGGGGTWGTITGTLSDQTDLQTELDKKRNKILQVENTSDFTPSSVIDGTYINVNSATDVTVTFNTNAFANDGDVVYFEQVSTGRILYSIGTATIKAATSLSLVSGGINSIQAVIRKSASEYVLTGVTE